MTDYKGKNDISGIENAQNNIQLWSGFLKKDWTEKSVLHFCKYKLGTHHFRQDYPTQALLILPFVLWLRNPPGTTKTD